MAQDIVYLQDKNLFISSSLVKIGGFAYQVKNITSYRRVRGGATILTLAPLLLGMIAVALSVPTHDQWVLGGGIAFVLLGLALLVATETLYLTTSAVQVRAFSTRNKMLMNAAVAALDQAIADNNR